MCRLSWIVSEYEVQSATASEDIEVGKLPGELIGHRFFRWDGNVRLVVNNPAKFPFWYTICMGDKTIAKGYATELDFARKDNGRKGLFDADSLSAGGECPDDTRRAALHGEKTSRWR